jgi:hypothetical protein
MDGYEGKNEILSTVAGRKENETEGTQGKRKNWKYGTSIRKK